MNRGPSTPGHGFTPRPGRPAGAAEPEEPTADDDDVRSARSYASVRSGASCVSSLSRPASTAARSAGGAPQASPARGAAASDASLASSTNGSPFRLVSPSSGTLLEGVHKAAFLGDSELLARCLHEQPECVARASPDGWLPLHYAAEHGHTECAEQLLGGRSNVDARGRDGWTPLMWAARRGHEAMVDVLLDAGADPSLAHVKGWTSLHLAAACGHTKICRRLVSAGANVFAVTQKRATALHLSVSQRRLSATRLLLQLLAATYGADPADFVERRDVTGSSALHVAAQADCPVAIIDLLLEHGARRDSLDAAGRNPLAVYERRERARAAAGALGAGSNASARMRARDSAERNRVRSLLAPRRAAADDDAAGIDFIHLIFRGVTTESMVSQLRDAAEAPLPTHSPDRTAPARERARAATAAATAAARARHATLVLGLLLPEDWGTLAAELLAGGGAGPAADGLNPSGAVAAGGAAGGGAKAASSPPSAEGAGGAGLGSPLEGSGPFLTPLQTPTGSACGAGPPGGGRWGGAGTAAAAAAAEMAQAAAKGINSEQLGGPAAKRPQAARAEGKGRRPSGPLVLGACVAALLLCAGPLLFSDTLACSLPPALSPRSPERCAALANLGSLASPSARLVSRAVAAEVARGAALARARNCSAPSEGDVWLASYPRGALYAFRGGRWGTVCVRGFDRYRTAQASYPAAEVVCRQLGYSSRGARFVGARAHTLARGADGARRELRESGGARRRLFYDQAEADAMLDGGEPPSAGADAGGAGAPAPAEAAAAPLPPAQLRVPMTQSWVHCTGSEPHIARCGSDKWAFTAQRGPAEATQCETHADDVILECSGAQGEGEAEGGAEGAEEGGGEGGAAPADSSVEGLRACGSRGHRWSYRHYRYDSTANWLGAEAAGGAVSEWAAVEVGAAAAAGLGAEGKARRESAGAGVRMAAAAALVAGAAALAAAAVVAARRARRQAAREADGAANFELL